MLCIETLEAHGVEPEAARRLYHPPGYMIYLHRARTATYQAKSSQAHVKAVGVDPACVDRQPYSGDSPLRSLQQIHESDVRKERVSWETGWEEVVSEKEGRRM